MIPIQTFRLFDSGAGLGKYVGRGNRVKGHCSDGDGTRWDPEVGTFDRRRGKRRAWWTAAIVGSLLAAIPAYVAASPPAATADPSSESGPGFGGTPYPAEKEEKVHAEQAPSPYGLTGDWRGLRDALEARGFSLQGLYTGEIVDTFGGGSLGKSGTIYHDNLDLTLNVDTGKAGLWNGGTLWFYVLQDHGRDPSAAMIGDLQTASNIAVPHDQFRLFEAWYDQNLADGAVSLLAGLHNLNSEFYVSDYASLFLNSSFGIGPELSANVPTSIFPKAGLGLRLRVKPSDASYLQAAIYDGDPASLALHPSEGYLDIAEAGYSTGSNNYKLGCWRHSADKTRSGSAAVYSSDYGFYGVVDQELVRFHTTPWSSLGMFVQLGWVPSDRNEVTGYFGTGLHLHGPFPGRGGDDVGIAMARATTHQDAETALELAYRFVVNRWLTLRPDFQWIFNPGGDKNMPTAKVGLFRCEVTL